MNEFLVARNPNAASALPFLLHLPIADGPIWLKARESWPRATRVYCHPLDAPALDRLEILERVGVVRCERRGSAIDLVLDRRINRRSQFVFTSSRGRPVILWQTPKAAMSARPGVRIPAAGVASCGVVYIDTRERYGYAFRRHHVAIRREALAIGDYAAKTEERVLGVVERKTLQDFCNSLVCGSLGLLMADLAAQPAAAVVVEASYSRLLRHPRVRRGLIAELIARLQVRYPAVPIIYLESRPVAEEWTYRFLRAIYEGVESLPL